MIREEVEGKYGGQELKESDVGLCQKRIYFLKVRSLSCGEIIAILRKKTGGAAVSVALEDVL